MDIFSNPIAMQVISIAVAGICGFLVAQVETMSKRDKALYDGMVTILRKEIVDAYETYVVNGAPLSYERKEMVDQCHSAYKALGGNSTGDDLYTAFSKVQVYIISKKED